MERDTLHRPGAMSDKTMSAPTPETDVEWYATLDWCNKRDEAHDPQHAALANLCEKLERERDEARGALRRIAESESTGDWGRDLGCIRAIARMAIERP
jgi:hypothetical protein